MELSTADRLTIFFRTANANGGGGGGGPPSRVLRDKPQVFGAFLFVRTRIQGTSAPIRIPIFSTVEVGTVP